MPAEAPPADWVPSYSGSTTTLRQGFTARGAVAGVHIAYYRDQRKGRELITSGNQLVLPHETRWKEMARSNAVVTVDGTERAAHRASLLGERVALVAYRLYWVDGRLTASEYEAKARLAWSRLTGGSGDGALVVVFAVERPERDVAREALEALLPSIQRALAAALEAK